MAEKMVKVEVLIFTEMIATMRSWLGRRGNSKGVFIYITKFNIDKAKHIWEEMIEWRKGFDADTVSEAKYSKMRGSMEEHSRVLTVSSSYSI
ncbi:hypothetical protein C5167_002642 [Papaver somniferum]|uniref:Uncharacterized protein n=1 Tax=Papaver somniferum TaxID=3469 RepID=A0A4Y7KYN3_PAPSO|nr:hypothetical protein C5167_002642 [Papaver somniferum]